MSAALNILVLGKRRARIRRILKSICADEEKMFPIIAVSIATQNISSAMHKGSANVAYCIVKIYGSLGAYEVT